MNQVKNIVISVIILLFAVSCEKEIDNLDKVDNASPPSNVSATFDIATNNSGLVTIMPTAEGVTKYWVLFGDDPYETPTEYGVNETITHTYGEGVFMVVITAVGISGATASYTQELNVTFLPPQNLVVTIEQDATNPYLVSVSASALYATIMDIYFGDVPDEEPVHAMPDSVVTHVYDEPGDYIITVVAKSAGEATTTASDTITITGASEPVNLPIDFESLTVNYAFTDFGGVTSSVITNPDQSGINTSSKVAQSLKTDGAQTWGGTYLTLENPIDFTVNKIFKVKVWSPKTDAMVKLKVENLDNPDIWYEVDQFTSVINEWEDISYDFSGASLDEDYQKVVIFFDFGNTGDNSNYFFDDIKLVPGDLPAFWPIEDFEGELPEITVFGDIPDVEVVANPDPTGANTTDNVAQLTKSSNAQTWAGAFFDVDSPLDLDNYSKVKVVVWSPKNNIPVLLKLEDVNNSSNFHEVSLNTSTSNEWEELVYDFSDAPDFDYSRIVIFFDFGAAGDDSVYYYDEFELTN
jgi:hypothetical protein